MEHLELKIPPPLVWLVCTVLALALAAAAPAWTLPFPAHRSLGLVIGVLGVACGLTGIHTFHKARTTVDPHHPEQATVLVTHGIYRFTRNPMYLGLALVLLAVIAWRANVVALLALAVLVAYLTRFQIRPEERQLHQLFGAAYDAYCQRVRRWI